MNHVLNFFERTVREPLEIRHDVEILAIACRFFESSPEEGIQELYRARGLRECHIRTAELMLSEQFPGYYFTIRLGVMHRNCAIVRLRKKAQNTWAVYRET